MYRSNNGISWQVLGVAAIATCVVVMNPGALATAQGSGVDLDGEQLEEMGLDEAPVAVLPPGASGRAPAALVDASLVLKEGDIPVGMAGPVTTINNPFNNGVGEVGFTGNADEHFVWGGSGVLFKSSDAVGYTLSGAEFSSGIGDGAAFIYSPSIDTGDGVWSHNGFLAVEETQAVGFPSGTLTTFHSRPSMVPSGRSYWIAGYGAPGGGTTTVGRVLYTSSDSTPANIEVELVDLTDIGGFTIKAQGISFDYDYSDDGQHGALQLILDTGSTLNDDVVAVDGAIVAREDDPSGDGDAWDNFDYVSINDSGDYLFTGDTNGDAGSDEYIAYNGAIVLREGDAVAGVTLGTTATLRGVALNNIGQAIHIWSYVGAGGTTESLFFACDAADLVTTSSLILSTNDELDFDGDGTADVLVTDFNASLGQISFPDTGQAFVDLDISYDGGTTSVGAVVGIWMPPCGAGNVFGHVDHGPVVVDPTLTVVDAWETAGGTLVATTNPDAAGDWALDLPADDYELEVYRANFLWGVYPATVTDAGNVVLPAVTLIGGDFDGSGDVALVDVTYVASRYNGGDLSADLNGNGSVDLVDVTATASAYGMVAPVPWP